jgi:hypothetical protein
MTMAVKILFNLLAPFVFVALCMACSDDRAPQQESPTASVEAPPAETAVQEKKEITIIQSWSGDYPVAQLFLLPDGQQEGPVGYIDDAATFAAVWEQFMPSEELPEVDFDKNIVVFSRNVQFYNRTNIFKVELENCIAEILAMETMSAIPIEDKVAMALAVIPREGVTAIEGRDGLIEVE